MTAAQPIAKIERAAHLRWVPIPQMRVSAMAQRDLNKARVDHLAANFDLEQIGAPVVNERDGHFYIIDGHHRIRALEAMGWGDQQVQCWTYTGLDETEEAERFLKLNNALPVNAFTKFRVGVQAGREIETDIDRIVRAQDLSVSQHAQEGAVGAVGTLRKVYLRDGAAVLGRTLRIIRDAYGDPGLEAPVIDGLGLLFGRYNGAVDDKTAISRLGDIHGGVNGLLNRANLTREQTKSPRNHCVAATAVDIINGGLRGKARLPGWWKADA